MEGPEVLDTCGVCTVEHTSGLHTQHYVGCVRVGQGAGSTSTRGPSHMELWKGQHPATTPQQLEWGQGCPFGAEKFLLPHLDPPLQPPPACKSLAFTTPPLAPLSHQFMGLGLLLAIKLSQLAGLTWWVRRRRRRRDVLSLSPPTGQVGREGSSSVAQGW